MGKQGEEIGVYMCVGNHGACSRNSRAGGREAVSYAVSCGDVGGATTSKPANARLRGSDLILRQWEDSTQANKQILRFTGGETETHT